MNIGFIYVGTIMGAGFASGREIWQFFGVFGDWGFMGVGFITVMFMIVGFMVSKVSMTLDTNDMGKIVVPWENRFLENFISSMIALALYLALVLMSAAGGALFYQQFGQSRILGGAVIVSLVVITVIGGFERVSKVFRFIMPVLMSIVVVTFTAAILGNVGGERMNITFEPSPLASQWWLAAILYLSFNSMGIIPIISTASINAKSKKHAYIGSVLGGLFLGALALMLLLAMKTDAVFSNGMDMPMLALSERLSPVINIVYTFALFSAIYGSATSTFYGFMIKVIKNPYRKLKIIGAGCLGFTLGLIGFTQIIAYALPIEGFLGISVILMLIVNFIKANRNGIRKNGK